MKKLILYKTKYGSTKQYALWIKEEIGESDIENLDDFDAKKLDSFDVIIIGSSTYMGRVSAKGFLEKNWHLLKNKKVFLFTVGVVPFESSEGKRSYEMISEEVRNGIAGHKKLPGSVKMDQLNFFEKLVANMKKGDKDKDEEGKIDKQAIAPIVNWVRSL